ncbi:MAG: hypothetical protein RPU39_04975 [Candidatus Sedimenticola sp. (ex Thyasira tokunagai)]
MKIYDCFTFYNEFDLLRLRLMELWEHVDHFVIAEGDRTFTNQEKPYNFEKTKHQFSEFLSKIIYIKVNDYPAYTGDPWLYEYHQRNALSRGLKQCHDDDLIMISDVDEIPNHEAITEFKDPISIFGMRVFYYKLNIECAPDESETKKIVKRSGVSSPWFGTRAVRYNDLKTPQNVRNVKAKIYPWWRINKGKNPHIIENGGWHFSFLMTEEEIEEKLGAFSHQEYNTREYNNPAYIGGCIKAMKAFDPGRESWKCRTIGLEEGMPDTLVNNVELFRKWLK